MGVSAVLLGGASGWRPVLLHQSLWFRCILIARLDLYVLLMRWNEPQLPKAVKTNPSLPYQDETFQHLFFYLSEKTKHISMTSAANNHLMCASDLPLVALGSNTLMKLFVSLKKQVIT